MNQDEIRSKSAALAELYTARANGKTLQHEISLTGDDRWIDHVDGSGPNLASDLSCWRVKPEPRRKWESMISCRRVSTTHDASIAEAWKAQGISVTEWVEVLP